VILVTHDFGVVADICDRVTVMQTGRIVETAPVRELFAAQQHPYTRTLLASTLERSEPGRRCPQPPRPAARARPRRRITSRRERDDHGLARPEIARRTAPHPLLELDDVVVEYPARAGPSRGSGRCTACR